jgi:MinD-like ATPase involved in chromosome partitioning or flagellar assembly
MAAELAHAGSEVLLVDADTYAASVAQVLGLLDESPGLVAAVRAGLDGRLDPATLARLAPVVAPRLRVLTGLTRAARWSELRPAGLQAVLTAGRALVDVVVLDLAPPLEEDEELSYDTAAPRRNGAALDVLRAADDVVVVGAADPVGLQRLVRALQDLATAVPAAVPVVVVTKVRADAVGRNPALRVTEALERFAGVRAPHLVPDDRVSTDRALLAGRTLLEQAPDSPARTACRRWPRRCSRGRPDRPRAGCAAAAAGVRAGGLPAGNTRAGLGSIPTMSDRLSALDASFLYAEEQGVPQHVGTVMIFEGPIDYPRLQRHLAGRIAFVPRYRKRVRQVPGRLANPVWVDDPRFDLGFHIRRLALPRPGSMDQLRELVARVHPRELDRSRPLWELYLVEGLEGDRFAVISKAHQALVDGIDGLDLAQVVLDTDPDVSEGPPDAWRPGPQPSAIDLVTGAVLEAAQRPAAAVQTVRRRAGDAQRTATRAVGALGRLAVARRAPDSPLDVELSQQRLFAVTSHPLARFRDVARRHSTVREDGVPRSARPSTTWCWRCWPGRCGPGSRRGASASARPHGCGRWSR